MADSGTLVASIATARYEAGFDFGVRVPKSGRPEYSEVIGERDFSSGHPAMQALNPSVYEMIVFLSQ